MNLFYLLLAFLGANAMMFVLILGGLSFFNLIFACAAAILANRKGRSGVNWFFLTLFWGIFGIVFLGCSKEIDKTEYETDTLSKVLWGIVVTPIIILCLLGAVAGYEKKKKVMQNEQISISNDSEVDSTKADTFVSNNYSEHPYKEVVVDLNDYLGLNDPDTDWNYTELSVDDEKSLMDQGVYYNERKNCWVRRIKE